MARSNEMFYVGEGSVMARKAGVGGEFRELGNITVFKTKYETESNTLRSGKKGGGNAARTDKVTAVTTEFTLNDLRPDNLALITNGQVFTDSAESITGEAHTAEVEEVILFNKMPDMSKPVVVKNEAGDVTFVENDDYLLSDQGIEVLSAGAIPADSAIQVDYTTAVVNRIEMLLNALGEDYEIRLDGLNANNGKPVRVSLYKHKFALASELDWLNESYAEVTISGECLADSSRQGAGLSKFMTVEMVD